MTCASETASGLDIAVTARSGALVVGRKTRSKMERWWRAYGAEPGRSP